MSGNPWVSRVFRSEVKSATAMDGRSAAKAASALNNTKSNVRFFTAPLQRSVVKNDAARGTAFAESRSGLWGGTLPSPVCATSFFRGSEAAECLAQRVEQGNIER